MIEAEADAAVVGTRTETRPPPPIRSLRVLPRLLGFGHMGALALAISWTALRLSPLFLTTLSPISAP